VEFAMVMEVSVKLRKGCTPSERDQVITNSPVSSHFYCCQNL
jgi:hypothetical protein